MSPLKILNAVEKGQRGIFPAQTLRDFITEGVVTASETITPDLVQPASIDLRLGQFAWRVQASFLPGPDATVEEKIRAFEMHRLDLSTGAILEKGCVYIVPLMESLALPPDISAFANPKSSTGRLDIFTRVISDRGNRFDLIRPGYSGPLYAEVSPRTFSVAVQSGSRLTQLRLRRGRSEISPDDLVQLHQESRLVDTDIDLDEVLEHQSLTLHLDLSGDSENGIVGWRARHHAGIVDVDLPDHYDPSDFWEPVCARSNAIILNPDDFYILATREEVTVPPDYAAEMVAYDTLVGEFRVHYAGFFDPGFGWDSEDVSIGSRGVLEVRSHDVPFMLEHEQVIGRLRFERLTARPEKIYGAGIGSHYQGQGLKLAKQFKRPTD
ncbi:MAG: Deoxycytidine triphosphate deaminase [Alphaproteobacteria bacterium MarineAlpha11_Bin1]|nr:MAG: Deoxycytidine triphosphate deaminase [Alphaproteobacteria bacterium MarineAlpha11_Bin1]|tara:strand:- start:15450 stop:16592 length:1143 start_codon:yes stop_codon:yes gene_type:complete